MKRFAINLPLLALLLAGAIIAGPAPTHAQEATPEHDPYSDCPALKHIDNPSFSGVIFYSTIEQPEQGRYTQTIWRLTSDLHSEPILILNAVEGAADHEAMHGKLVLEIYNFSNWRIQGPGPFPDHLLVFNDQGRIVRYLSMESDWTDFYGWTNDDRLIIGHRSQNNLENGILLLNPNGYGTTYTGFPNALDPFDEYEPYWYTVGFHVSPNGKQVVYDAAFLDENKPFIFSAPFPQQNFLRGLILANLATGAEVWRTDPSILNDDSYGGSWGEPFWSPDGSHFVLPLKASPNDPELALVDSQGNEQYLTHINDLDANSNIVYSPTYPTWNPNGNSIAFWKAPIAPDGVLSTTDSTSADAPRVPSELTVLDIKSGTTRFLCVTRNAGGDDIYWSPDGNSLIVTALKSIDLIDLEHNTIADLPAAGEAADLLGWV